MIGKAPKASTGMIHATFVMEQHVGHQTLYRNLRRGLGADPRITPTWVEVSYQPADGFWQAMPGLPGHLTGTLVGRAQVRQGLRRAPYDVAFFNTQVPAVLGGRLARRRPYVLCTDITPIQYDQMAYAYGHRPDRNKWLAWYKHRLNRSLFRQAVRVVAWSTWTRASLMNDYAVDAERVEVLPPGIDLDQWQPAPRERSGPLRILFVGGDFERKGGADLIRAFHTFPAGQVELVVVTRSPVAPAPGISVYGNMLPNSPELIALCQSCDVFALPTQAEAFGIAAAEASALGLPVIATAVGGLPDIVVDGATGFLIQPGDWSVLAQHLQRLAADAELRRRLGRAARQRAVARFDLRQNAARIASIVVEANAGNGCGQTRGSV